MLSLGVGSFTYQFNSRDTLGFAAKGAWFQNNGAGIDIYKDPITDDGTKKSLKGFVKVMEIGGTIRCIGQCSEQEESEGLLQPIFKDGVCFETETLTGIRKKIDELVLSKAIV